MVFVLQEWLDLFCSLVYFWSPSHAIIHFQLFCYVIFSNSALVSLPFINGVTRLQTSSCHKKDMKILRIIIFILVYGRICNKKSKEWGANIETKILPFSHSYFVHFWCKCVSWISKIMKQMWSYSHSIGENIHIKLLSVRRWENADYSSFLQ